MSHPATAVARAVLGSRASLLRILDEELGEALQMAGTLKDARAREGAELALKSLALSLRQRLGVE